ncbi:MAG: hypothetical protein E5X34_13300 [Mesorhizobium sp.]|uniref:hypothetical protein n=1 Tax=Mesorhizobium sp. TaxID=1871066 RepID=UPI0011FDE1B2|nr:hypothetical protein [Mesorhizobium sp.]TIR24025.1 MAG: hypothetical protein E5X34_13300 [Mesorhizobium sp.]
MTTPFAELEKQVSAEIDAHHGEATRIVRKAAGQYFSRVADGARANADVIGVVDHNPVMARPKDQGQYDGFQPGVAGSRISVSYAVTRFADKAAWPQDGDEIWLLDPDRLGAKLRVTRADPDGLGRIDCICVPA